ncbi:MAG TPA: aminopeptidase N [Segeticoccus sp.]|uniref:aminopeptidase N n=1 Tax=Segeticoccus sp. TaxID=2706531 RepID=UPI002D7FA266|nr:aminopeptidase N [Segeticoccus sp.]HET8599846.1 aminopeptidase N [Segeticoccus sp.]
MANLTRAEAEARAALIAVTAYEVDLDLDRDETTFESTSRVRFTCTRPGAATFLDVAAQQVHEIALNGRSVDPATVADNRVELADLDEDNEVVVRATMRFSRDGQGLHRAVDSADGRAYVYGHVFLDAAPRVFACFDQPDLKAPFDVTVTAPADWVVLGNGAAQQVEPGRWRLATTKPLATYFVTVCAGPYVSVRDEHDGIPLGIHARASLRGPLERQAPQMLEVTKASFDYYHRLFGIRYPFGEYHQVFVPEFNAGAMENPGCVVLRDQYVFRGAATYDEVLTRSNTIAHEMAHMWFGDLVTMQWWDDLWLNESFAEYMSHRTLVDATEFTDAWVDSAMARKTWGYAAERMPSTHPVAGSPAPDAASALQNFDGISYAKGAAVLRQLIAWIGDEAFIAGVSDYLRRHEFGNAALADFLAAMERASGEDLTDWSRAWLGTAGRDALHLAVEESDGQVLRAVAHRATPPQFPAARPHALDVAGFSGGREVYRRPVTLDDAETEVAELAGAPAARIVVPNASDLSWADVKLSAVTLAALPEELALVPDVGARAVVWNAVFDGVAQAEIDPREAVRLFGAAWPREANSSILTRVSDYAAHVLVNVLPPPEQEGARQVLARSARELLDRADPGSTQALVATRLLAATSDDENLLSGWAAGRDLPEGLAGDNDFRWIAVRTLAFRGLIDAAGIDEVLAQDRTMTGNLGALRAKAARPTAEAKAWAWEELTGEHGRSNYEMNALAAGFWRARDLEVVRPYVARYFTDVPAMQGRVGEDALERVATAAYPSPIVEQATVDATEEALRRGDLGPSVRRSMVDEEALLREALRSRERFSGVENLADLGAFPPISGEISRDRRGSPLDLGESP